MSRKLLALGLDGYPHLSNLAYAAADARALGNLFREPEFDFESIEVHAFEEKRHLDRTSFLQLFAEKCAAFQAGDEVVLYFAGHGFAAPTEADDKGNRIYIAASDSRRESHLQTETSIDLSTLVRMVERRNPSRAVLILDTCRSLVSQERGHTGENGFLGSLRTAVNDEWVNAECVWEVVSGCHDGEVSIESDALSGGVFTRGLLRTAQTLLKEVRSGSRSGVTVQDLVSKMPGDVAGTPDELSGRQSPWHFLGRDGERGSMQLIRRQPPTRNADRSRPAGKFVRSYVLNDRKLSSEDREIWHEANQLDPSARQSSVSMHLVQFQSAFDREDLRQVDIKEISRRNSRFLIRLYLPPESARPAPPYSEVYVMLNGLAESNSKVFDDVAIDLAQRGIPSILIPLPRHLTRFVPLEDHPDPFRPPKELERLYSQQVLQSVYKNPGYIVQAYAQIKSDVEQLRHRLRDSEDEAFRGLFAEHLDISLFGYSIGGLYSLALMVQEFEAQVGGHELGDKPYLMNDADISAACDAMRYKTAFLLESGAPIDRIDTSRLYYRHKGISELLGKWYLRDDRREENIRYVTAGVERLFSGREAEREKTFGERADSECSDMDFSELFVRNAEEAERVWYEVMTGVHESVDALEPRLAKVFRRVFLGDNPIVFKAQLNALSRRILVVTGGADEIFPASLLLSGPTSVLATIQVPGISHWLKAGAQGHWGYWRHLVVDLVVRFNQTAEGK